MLQEIDTPRNNHTDELKITRQKDIHCILYGLGSVTSDKPKDSA